MIKSVVLKFANYVGESGLYRSLCPGRVPVFMLHRVSDTGEVRLPGGMTADVLRSHLDYLATHGYQVLSMADLQAMLERDKPLPSKSVMFTIDDGFFDHHDVAARVFEEFGFVLNFFVITGFLDRDLWPWDDHVAYALHRAGPKKADIRLPSGVNYLVDLLKDGIGDTVFELRSRLKKESQSHLYNWLKVELYPSLDVEFPAEIPPEFKPMSWSNARALRDSGHGVFPHTCSHRILSALTIEEKRSEIEGSIKRIEAELNYVPEVFAYPTGRLTDYDRLDIEQLDKSGIQMAFTTVPEYVQAGQNWYELPRFSLPCSSDDFRQIVNGFEAFKMKLRELAKFPH
ncbi:polysaccharide deacetylase family protein [Marinobacter sp. F4206]|uniref:polysaccharide deacetylase family protein n=1 Tax=Marinobacter sp. F4206 TaxID=2861777 RepID=UPI001C604FC7|nr:polysaccharide deacetylase family protein [Marinobacter sp. F4206]MBW4933412.1 polysaccharide deacetylase family protein [Marinobacter sp. F4206]